MADTIKVPGIKDPLPKPAVYGGVAITIVAVIVYYRNQKNQAAAAPVPGTGLGSGGLAPDSGLLAGDTSSAYPWDGTYGNPSDPYSLDTTSGQTYGNEGYLGGFGASGGGGGGGSGNAPGPPFSNNQQWSAFALQQDGGAHPNMTEALGLYLDGQALNADQQDLVYRAQALAGPVPVPGPGGYPPKLRTAGGGGKPKGGTVFAVNPVADLRARPANSPALLPPPGGGKVPKPKTAGLEITWEKSAHATGYQVSARNLTAHRTALSPVTTAKTSYTVSDLQAGDTYEVTVLARPAEKGARPARVQVRA